MRRDPHRRIASRRQLGTLLIAIELFDSGNYGEKFVKSDREGLKGGDVFRCLGGGILQLAHSRGVSAALLGVMSDGADESFYLLVRHAFFPE